MGGAVSSGCDNDDLIDKLKEKDYIKTPQVERIFRMVDRAHYYLEEARDTAYEDMAWKDGTLHLSAPCIYSKVMEALDLHSGLSFLNLGSGTGYLNTMVGFAIGPYGINHGIELHERNVEYAKGRLEEFVQYGERFDDMEFCEPQFVVGNCLNIDPEGRLYDRVYCGAACPAAQLEVIENLVKVGGILVTPVADQLLKVKRVSEKKFSAENVLPVSFASLVMPSETPGDKILMPEVNPISLQCITRSVIRNVIRSTFEFSLPVSKVPTDQAKKKPVTTVIRHSEFNFVPTSNGIVFMPFPGTSARGWYTYPSLDDLDPALGSIFESSSRQSIADAENHRNNEEGDQDEELGAASFSQRDVVHHTRPLSFNEFDLDLSDEESDDKKSSRNSLSVRKPLSYAGFKNKSGTDEEGEIEGVERVTNRGKVLKRDDEERKSSMSSDEGFDLTCEAETKGQLMGSSPVPVGASTSKGGQLQHQVSYSTSADTSGFGSLGDDPDIPDVLSRQQKEMSTESDMEQVPDTLTARQNESNPSAESQTAGTDTEHDLDGCLSPLDEENVGDVIGNDVEPLDISAESSEDDGDEEDIIMSPVLDRFYRMVGAHEPISPDEPCKESCKEEADERKKRQPGADACFSAYLKEKVDTLPIPNAMKSFILHFR